MFWFIYSRPKFSTQMPQLFITKICFRIKVNSIYGVGRDTRNLCHKISSQGPALRILGLRVASPKSQVPGLRVSSLRVPGSRVSVSQGPRSRISGSQVSDPDFRLCHEFTQIFFKMSLSRCYQEDLFKQISSHSSYNGVIMEISCLRNADKTLEK